MTMHVDTDAADNRATVESLAVLVADFVRELRVLLAPHPGLLAQVESGTIAQVVQALQSLSPVESAGVTARAGKPADLEQPVSPKARRARMSIPDNAGARVISLLADSVSPLNLADVANGSGLEKNVAARVLRNLVAAGAARMSGRNRGARYSLSGVDGIDDAG